jgi:uncharacterized protein YjbI with pentapeptide repeats
MDQTREALPQRAIKALNVIGFPSFLRDGFMPLCRNDPLIGIVLIRMEGSLFAVHHGDVGPQRFGAVTTAIPDVKRNDLACLSIHSNPDPRLMGFLLYKAPHLIGFGFQLSNHDVCWLLWQLDVSMVGTGRKALDHTVQEPGEADAHGTADTAQRDALAQQVCNQGALLVRNALARVTLRSSAVATNWRWMAPSDERLAPLAQVRQQQLQATEAWFRSQREPDLSEMDRIKMTRIRERLTRLWQAAEAQDRSKEAPLHLHEAHLGGAHLRGADLHGATLYKADLYAVDLREAHLGQAILCEADLRWAFLIKANVLGANLWGANLHWARLGQADLREATLYKADLTQADLTRATLTGAHLDMANIGWTTLANVDLSTALKLETAQHEGPSSIDIDTLYRSQGNIPEVFLRGAGVPEDFITYIKSLVGHPFEFYSCFISYSSKDQEFAERLHADLQNKGVRCWFAPEDIQGGRKLHEQIDQAIRLHERLLLILSTDSMQSEWVKTEIAKARQREVREKRQVLFPMRLVSFEALRDWECFDADTGKDSAREIREYFIPDFSNWKNHDAYQMAFQRLLRDLKAGI